ncbi:MAG: hypothetical protein ABSG68_23965, partial [Thermoguttaceae bacterium]
MDDRSIPYPLTPGAQRALDHASDWCGGDELSVPALILGLLAEPECRAALILARHAVTAANVADRWSAE